MLQSQPDQKPDIIITSDASGKWGCGAFCDQKWFQLEWPRHLEATHITVKELIPIVLVACSSVGKRVARPVSQSSL